MSVGGKVMRPFEPILSRVSPRRGSPGHPTMSCSQCMILEARFAAAQSAALVLGGLVHRFHCEHNPEQKALAQEKYDRANERAANARYDLERHQQQCEVARPRASA